MPTCDKNRHRAIAYTAVAQHREVKTNKKVEMKKHTHPCVNEPCPTTAGMVDVLLSSG